MSTLPAQRRYGSIEYLALERAAQERHELVDGEIRAMAGGNRRHSAIASRLGYLLERALEGQGCEPFTSDMKVHVPATGSYRYPDASVACEPAFQDSAEDVLVNPCVIFEVLSKTTEAEDRGDKFDEYRSIPSFREYVLIWQKKVLVEHYSRQADGKWSLALLPAGETLRLCCAPVEIAVVDLYARVRELLRGEGS